MKRKTMKKPKLLITTLLLFFTNATISYAQTIEVSGIVSGIWDVDTVKVVGDIEVREALSLNISPGVQVIFEGEYFFNIQGAVKAIGSDIHPIVFSIIDTAGFHNDTLPGGGWKNIRLEDIKASVDSTVFSYCHFEYGKAVSADSVYGYGGALCIRNSDKVSIENCTFYSNYAFYNGGAVYLENASIKLINNNFENNRCGQTFTYYGYGGGLCTDWGQPNIHQNTFTENSSTGIGGGLCVRFSDCMVSHNIFKNNFSALGGGFGILHIASCNFVISNNLFTQNSAEFFGAAISNGDCSPTYVNNTITDNHCIGGGGGFYCKDSVVPVLYNNIIYGNTQFWGEVNQVYLWDLLSQPNFYYNDIEGGKENFYGTGGTAFNGEYENNIDENPLFEPGQFSILPESLCVNAGTPDTSGLLIPETDLANNQRIVNGIIDLGAYENQQNVGIKNPGSSKFIGLKISPNPTYGIAKLSFEIKENPETIIRVVSALGKEVYQAFYENLEPGKQTFDIDFSDLVFPAGIYHIIIENGNIRMEEKIMILK